MTKIVAIAITFFLLVFVATTHAQTNPLPLGTSNAGCNAGKLLKCDGPEPLHVWRQHELPGLLAATVSTTSMQFTATTLPVPRKAPSSYSAADRE